MNHSTSSDLATAGVFISILLAIILSQTGCAIPALTGLKSIRTSGGTEISFMTGTDFHVGMNGVDRVEDKRGIAPTVGLKVEKQY